MYRRSSAYNPDVGFEFAIPNWHIGNGIEHCSFTGRPNLPQERLLLHLGFVKESTVNLQMHSKINGFGKFCMHRI